MFQVQKFLSDILAQIKDWLVQGRVKKLVVVLNSVETREVLERWFHLVVQAAWPLFLKQVGVQNWERKGGGKGCRGSSQGGEEDQGGDQGCHQVRGKPKICEQKQYQEELFYRQITASVTFLPLLDCLCSFDILIYTHRLDSFETFLSSLDV